MWHTTTKRMITCISVGGILTTQSFNENEDQSISSNRHTVRIENDLVLMLIGSGRMKAYRQNDVSDEMPNCKLHDNLYEM